MAYHSPELSGGSKDPILGHIYVQKGHVKDPNYGHQKISIGHKKIPFWTNKKIHERDRKDPMLEVLLVKCMHYLFFVVIVT